MGAQAMTEQRIAFQGEPGAYSHLACRKAQPRFDPLPCANFEDAMNAVESGDAALAMIPIENAVAGRVADIHRLLPDSALHIVAERFIRVRHQLLGPKGASQAGVKRVHSHPMALAQCRAIINRLGATIESESDTAAAARLVAEWGNPEDAALASPLAAEIHDLDILAPNVEDDPINVTRFLEMAREPAHVTEEDGPFVTSFVFRVRNVPAALYKCMGGFATNGVNMTKLESYLVGDGFTATQFYAEVDGRPTDPPVMRAFEELQFFSAHLRVLGVYPAAPYRHGGALNG